MRLAFDAVSAYDAAYSGLSTQVVDHIGRTEPFDVPTWAAEADWVDHALFIAPCDAGTIDVGCGPGRLVGALTSRQVPAMGIDVSSEAVRQTRDRGAHAERRSVFSALPGEGSWAYALLADGNLGIGGDPARLLERLGEVLAPGGQVIAEVDDHGAGLVRERRQLRVDGRLSAPFDWAVVGLDAIEQVAASAGMEVLATSTIGGRHTATLHRMP
ncbi:class I SAM-dependent methyltransferase [Aeromicrobium wangtongii]|uniref:Class I SAM-dependent methyltransferase n=1 Tax=Aeromicrobium wangtongii TaxID=2969247 RepID=A0ABY5M5V6_9ACTN|nr:class I SAM-dependent methyltransferase [Aeromicrobium wangtongii]MCD9199937.1 class I SAM-dependent methyltransferase [Aeromicrobium wangtongii]UUP13553.1 class I SAM-dependent methyltransferase [Aeromicrobium wangtongii]